MYRDTTGLGDDRSSRLTGLIRHCQLSYRAGTRFNPDEVTFKGKQAVPAAAAPDKKKKDNLTIEVELNKEQRSFVGTGAVPKRRSRESTKVRAVSLQLMDWPAHHVGPTEQQDCDFSAFTLSFFAEIYADLIMQRGGGRCKGVDRGNFRGSFFNRGRSHCSPSP